MVFLGMATKKKFRNSVGISPVSYILLMSFCSIFTPASCKAISISKTSSFGPAAFPVLEICNAHLTFFLSADGADSPEIA